MRVSRDAGLPMRAPRGNEGGFEVEVAPRPAVIVPGEEVTETNADTIYTTATGATIDEEADISVSPAPGTGVTVTNLTPEVATLAGGRLTRVSDGTAMVRVASAWRVKEVEADIFRTTEPDVLVRTSFVPGSLAYQAASAVDDRLAGSTASAAMAIYSSQNHSTKTYVRNPNCWAPVSALTCISPWNSTGGAQRGGIAVSPRHILFVTHFPISVGATIRFVTADGTVIERTLTGRSTLEGHVPDLWSDSYIDIMVGVLDSDLPSSIGFAKVLPDNWTSYLPGMGGPDYKRIPCLSTDQQEKALVRDFWKDDGIYEICLRPADAKRLEFYEDWIPGDSGSQVMMLDGDDPVLLFMATNGGAGRGRSVFAEKEKINSTMTTLGGGYQLTPADFSGFTNFG